MTDSDEIEIINERLFAVDRQTLFDSFADPKKLCDWWGPDGFTNTIHVFNLTPGGEWKITMTASNGTDFVNHSTFLEVEAPKRISFIHHEPIHVYRMEMAFGEEAGGTRLIWRMFFKSCEENQMLKTFIAAANEQNFDRLERLLGIH
ncbi:SRPBCC domain-containing protein [Rhizobium oryziradicis]|uniref:ATPase n=1 Tax=Rhizobium oryziradicis TaxID=1867956 RepID=A0A1Q8ZR45_9HYPH|nr:SRPBCC domain-containing protein [Rhizobium oryziradicis]OLP44402.1 ATPase [Rhizobium oryziradicis]